MITQYDQFNSADITVMAKEEAFPDHVPFANMRFGVKPGMSEAIKSKLVGPGIYALFFDGELIYIGKYLGQKNAPFAGNVANLRWVKHLGGMTLRERRVSFSMTALSALLEGSVVDTSHPVVAALRAAAGDGARSKGTRFLIRDRGCLSTVNRARLAIENWGRFADLSDTDLAAFSFHYVRLSNEAARLETRLLRTAVSIAEVRLIETFQPRCNAYTEPEGNESTSTPEAVAESIARELEASLQASSTDGTERIAQQSVQSLGKGQTVEERDRGEPEETSDAASFENKIADAPVWALNIVQELTKFAASNSSIELHHTDTDGGDLRLRRYALVRKGPKQQNFIMVFWKPRNTAMKIHSILPVKDANLPEFLRQKLASFDNGGPLNSVMTLDETVPPGMTKSILDWVRAGYDHLN